MSRRALLVVVTLAATAAPLSARAGGVDATIADGILTVSGTSGGDSIVVRCEGGDVTVNGSRPSGGPDACASLRRIEVVVGGGRDDVDLGDVTRSAFGDLRAVVVRGEAGDDTLVGSAFGDDLGGGRGEDVLRGGQGADRLSPGGGGADAFGGRGLDLVSVGGDTDWTVDDGSIVRGGSGVRIALDSIEQVSVLGGPGPNRISATSFRGRLWAAGRLGDDVLEGGSGDDRLRGGDGNDRILGDIGDDVLRGGANRDVLRGGSGNDELRGGSGPDDCIGGPGADSFLRC